MASTLFGGKNGGEAFVRKNIALDAFRPTITGKFWKFTPLTNIYIDGSFYGCWLGGFPPNNSIGRGVF